VVRRTVINDRYELTEPIGRGGMGEVWAGRDARLDRKVAVKLIRYPDGVPREDFNRRFVRESRITARLQHPGVPAIYDAGSHQNRLYLVMQCIEGIRLADLIAEHGQLPVNWSCAIAAQICSVLAVAHRASLVHRDLKPGNVMLERDGGVKVLDFGLAAAPALPEFSKITSSGAPIGTLAYMAPEQVLAGVSGPATDLYALGCTLYEMLVGGPPFPAGSEAPFVIMNKQVNEAPPPPRALRRDVPAALEQLILDLLEKRLEDRPTGAEAVYQRLLPFIDGLGALPGVLDPPSPPSPVRMYAGVLSRVFADAAAAPSEPEVRSRRPATGARPPRQLKPIARADLNRVRDEAAVLARESRFSEAADVLSSTVEHAGRTFGDSDRSVIDLRLQLATMRFEGGDYRTAAPEYRRLASDLAALDGPESESVLRCRLKEATCYALAGDTTRALGLLDGLLLDHSRIFGADDPRAIELRRQVALLQLGGGQREAATATLRRLETDLVRLHGVHHDAVNEVRSLLARLERAGP